MTILRILRAGRRAVLTAATGILYTRTLCSSSGVLVPVRSGGRAHRVRRSETRRRAGRPRTAPRAGRVAGPPTLRVTEVEGGVACLIQVWAAARLMPTVGA